MPLIPYPNVPAYPGVPSIPRTSPGSPAINVALANPQSPAPAKTQSASYATEWGIYDLTAEAPIYMPTAGGTLSFVSLDYDGKMQISDFPIEGNAADHATGFASYNKVWTPTNLIVTLALTGTDNEKNAFLFALESARQSTNLYQVNTPEVHYQPYSIESYSYERTAERGATMLTVQISLKEILQVQPVLYNPSTPTPINSPKSPSAVSQANNGITQAQPYTGSTAIVHKLVGGPK